MMQILLTDRYSLGRIPELSRLPKSRSDALSLFSEWLDEFERLNGHELMNGLKDCLKSLDESCE